MSINEQRKRKLNHLIDSANIIRSKPRREMTCNFCKQKAYKVTNYDRRLSIGKEVDGNDLIHYMENSCPFKIADESEIGTIISSKEMVWKDV